MLCRKPYVTSCQGMNDGRLSGAICDSNSGGMLIGHSAKFFNMNSNWNCCRANTRPFATSSANITFGMALLPTGRRWPYPGWFNADSSGLSRGRGRSLSRLPMYL